MIPIEQALETRLGEGVANYEDKLSAEPVSRFSLADCPTNLSATA